MWKLVFRWMLDILIGFVIFCLLFIVYFCGIMCKILLFGGSISLNILLISWLIFWWLILVWLEFWVRMLWCCKFLMCCLVIFMCIILKVCLVVCCVMFIVLVMALIVFLIFDIMLCSMFLEVILLKFSILILLCLFWWLVMV